MPPGRSSRLLTVELPGRNRVRTRLQAASVFGSVRLGLWILCCWCIGLSGCGQERYEQRLAATTEYFKYLNVVDESLSPNSWSSGGIQGRVPRQFSLMPPPEIPEDDDPTPVFDRRQPDYINLELPGLEGAWRAEVPVIRDDETVEGTAFLYVLSNGPLWIDPDLAEQAPEFNQTVINLLSSELRYRIEDTAWFDERLPVGHNYTARKTYRGILLKPDRPIDGMMKEFAVYQTEVGEIQVTILLVVPRDIDPREKLSERVRMFLETLKVSGQKPTGSDGGGGLSTAPGPAF